MHLALQTSPLGKLDVKMHQDGIWYKSDMMEVRAPSGFRRSYAANVVLKDKKGLSNIILTDDNNAIMVVKLLGPIDDTPISYFYARQLAAHPDAPYKIQKGNWFVLSYYGDRGASIVYERVTKVGPALIDTTIMFPTAFRRQYDPRLGRITKHFVRPGKGLMDIVRGRLK